MTNTWSDDYELARLGLIEHEGEPQPTYAEEQVGKTAAAIILHSNITAQELKEYLFSLADIVMQAQREACADVFEKFGEFPPAKTENLKREILNAEVKP